MHPGRQSKQELVGRLHLDTGRPPIQLLVVEFPFDSRSTPPKHRQRSGYPHRPKSDRRRSETNQSAIASVRLVYGVRKIVTKLVDNQADFLVVVVDDTFPNGFFQPLQSGKNSVSVLHQWIQIMEASGLLKCTELPSVVQLVIKAALDRALHRKLALWAPVGAYRVRKNQEGQRWIGVCRSGEMRSGEGGGEESVGVSKGEVRDEKRGRGWVEMEVTRDEPAQDK